MLFRRWRAGRWREVPAELYNRAWRTPYIFESLIPKEEAPFGGLSGGLIRRIAILGILGCILWIPFADFTQDAPPVNVGRNTAEEIAADALKGSGYVPGDEWTVVSTVSANAGNADVFTWQTGGKTVYDALMGKNLNPPQWLVRYVKFGGPVEERAEEFRIMVAGDGTVRSVGHRLPEESPGDTLSREAARAIADSVIVYRYGVDMADMKIVSEEPFQLPARRDWIFTYADTVNFPLSQGEDRIRVRLSGSAVSQAERTVHIPEDWQRNERNRENAAQIIRILSMVVLYGFFIAGAVYALIQWSRKRFDAKMFRLFFLSLGGIQILGFINRWPEIISSFSTSMPYSNQVIIEVTSGVVSALVIGALAGLVAGLIQVKKKLEPDSGTAAAATAGSGLAAILAGVGAAVAWLLPQTRPAWASYAALSHVFPVAGIVLSSLAGYIMQTLWFFILFIAMHRFSNGWRNHKKLSALLFLVFGLCISGTLDPHAVLHWFAGGLGVGIVLLLLYMLVLRNDFSILPYLTAGISVFDLLEQAVIGAYPGAAAGSVIAALALIGTAAYWYSLLRKEPLPLDAAETNANR